MNVLIIGYGSIGRRHKSIFDQLGLNTFIVSRRSTEEVNSFKNINEVPNNLHIDYLVICSKTSEHLSDLKKAKEKWPKVNILVEKPLFSTYESDIEFSDAEVIVAYNLRFHPLVTILKSKLEGKKILNSMFYVGQYLPDWRPKVDYRNGYSASSVEGGGVLRDLSHELDLALFFFNKYKRVICLKDKISNLEIQSEDSASIIASMENCPQVMIHLNYLNRVVERQIIINTLSETYKLDFVKGKLWENGVDISVESKISETYEIQAKKLINGDLSSFSKYSDGLHINRVIQSCEISSQDERWIYI